MPETFLSLLSWEESEMNGEFKRGFAPSPKTIHLSCLGEVDKGGEVKK
jgi:hypothetical protein